MILSLTGCAKLVSTEYENVEVNIVDEKYSALYTTYYYIPATKTVMPMSHSAEYRIVVEYKDVEYSFRDKDTYNKYKEKVGQTTIGTLEIRTYDDGTVIYIITELE